MKSSFWLFSFGLSLLGIVGGTEAAKAEAEAESEATVNHRHLSLAEIAGYQPFTVVTDANAIDQDLILIEEFLAQNDDDHFHQAFLLYMNGGHSGPYAELTLVTGLQGDAVDGSLVLGKNDAGVSVRGSVFGNYTSGTSTIRVKYSISEIQDNYVACKVGALPLLNASDTTGCFAQQGTVDIADLGEYSYSYVVNDFNKNAISFAGFSTQNLDSSTLSKSATFTTYYNYYQDFSYANTWVRSAIQAAITDTYVRGRADFGDFNYAQRSVAAAGGIVMLSTWMEVIRQMDEMVLHCGRGQSLSAQRHWDLAVAFYTGSLEGTMGDTPGRLLHQMADDMCIRFRSCGNLANEAAGRSFVNREILRNFRNAKGFLIQGTNGCGDLWVAKRAVEQYMVIPLIQGTLMYAYERGRVVDSPDNLSIGATFAAAISPLINACNAADASIIQQNLGTSSKGKTIDYAAVKKALEDNYPCLQVSCATVGAYFDYDDGTAYPGAEACTDSPVNVGSTTPAPTPAPIPATPPPTWTNQGPSSSSSSESSDAPRTREERSKNQMPILGGVFGGATVFFIILLAVLVHAASRAKETEPEFMQGQATIGTGGNNI